MLQGARRRWVSGFWVAALSLVSCDAPEPRSAEADFRAVDRALVEAYVEFAPLAAELNGASVEEIHLPTYSEAAVDRFRRRVGELRERLVHIDASSLPPDLRPCREALLQTTRIREVCDGRLHAGWGMHPYNDPIQLLLLLSVYHQLEGGPAPQDYVRLLGEIPGFLASYRQRLLRGIEEGSSPPPREFVDGAIDTISRLLSTAEDDLPFLPPPEAQESPEGRRWRREVLDAWTQVVRPALEEHVDFLVSELRIQAEPGRRLGSAGRACFEEILDSVAGSRINPAQLHERLLLEVERRNEELVELGESPRSSLTAEELRSQLTTVGHRTSEEVSVFVDEVLERAGETAPQLVEGAESLPEFRRLDRPAAFAAPAFYIPPSFDGTRPGTILLDFERSPDWMIELSLFHEAVPGHHLARSVAASRPDLLLSLFLFRSRDLLEGWALYAEELAWEADLYSDERARRGLLFQQRRILALTALEVGLHALDWSWEEGCSYLTAELGVDDWQCDYALSSALAAPGHYLPYVLGYLEIRDLRSDAQGRLGESFDLSQFHYRLLRNGPVPLSVARDEVEAWITE